jgi:hypothetical protein
VTTDDAGRALFTGVRLGEWAVALAPRDSRRSRADEFARYAEPCTVAIRGEVVQVALELRGDLFIEGVVHSPAGEAPDAMVFARAPGFLATASAFARDNGSFRVGPLLPGEYTLWVQPATTDAIALIAPLTETVRAGTVGVQLRLVPGARLTVRTVDAGAALPAETCVRALPGGGQSRSAGAKAVTSFTHLAPGRYSVRSVSAEGRVGEAEVELQAGQVQELELALAPGAVLDLRNVDAQCAATVRVERNGAQIVAGELAAADDAQWPVAPGSYTVVFAWLEPDPASGRSTPGAERRLDVEVGRAGDTRTLELRR